ncbi:hypothetical protein PAPYR_3909 [Paratrimastix pyriformis]|uniref:Endonuclease/exonuclease/phosphatase domain-containing protein n=1 Tax=Paratrimastix pyriformis TaxID=342808 RepID=A0ABQ8UQ71_9EUKA|nr:hypothetical protein PAPYR_3909 [Paratrimastix pyriformis]
MPWRERVGLQCDFLLEQHLDVICLQEFDFDPNVQAIFTERLGPFYTFFLAWRPAGADGVATLIRKPSTSTPEALVVERASTLKFLCQGRRVALLTVLRRGTARFTLVNTHLTFPHHDFDRALRLEQTKKIALALCLHSPGLPVLLCGDFNGNQTDRCLLFLKVRNPRPHQEDLNNDLFAHLSTTQAQGWVSVYDQLHPAPGEAGWVTHCNHKGEQVGVDFQLTMACQPTPEERAIDEGYYGATFACSGRKWTLTELPVPGQAPSPLCPGPSPSPSPAIPQPPLPSPSPHSAASACISPTPAGPPGARVVLRACSAAILPPEFPTGAWPAGWLLSDHRPVLCHGPVAPACGRPRSGAETKYVTEASWRWVGRNRLLINPPGQPFLLEATQT